MARRLRTEFILGLAMSSLFACGGDDHGSAKGAADAGAHDDAGAVRDAGTPSFDASTPLDSGLSTGDGGSTTSSSEDASVGEASDGGMDGGGAVTLHATLTVEQETPPCARPGLGANGTATIVVSPSNNFIELTLEYAGLSGSAVMAHIHYGATGVSGPPVLNFGTNDSGGLDSPITEMFSSQDYSAASPAPASFTAFVADLKAGKTYVNVHTGACPDGEIRGQIQ